MQAAIEHMVSERIALVIGNAAYSHTWRLPNPVHDARAVSGALERLNFNVQFEADLTTAEINNAFRRFEDHLAKDAAIERKKIDVALLYYTGHGFQIDGENYLIPVDAIVERKNHVKWQTTALKNIISFMSEYARTVLIFLDSCHNDPFSQDREISVAENVSLGSIAEGLAPVRVPPGCFVALSALPGTAAQDGPPGEGSPFTSAFLKHVFTDGQSIDDLMRKIREEVSAVTKGQQIPWVSSSLIEQFYFYYTHKTKRQEHNNNNDADIDKRQLDGSIDDSIRPITLGASLQLSRDELDGELYLNFKEYALALARVFRDAQGEFCMALLGRWGAGKTRLAKQVERLLTDSEKFKAARREGKLSDAYSDEINYSVVWFSSWQYRRVPEAWIYLYETFAKAIVRGNGSTLDRAARIIRTNISKRGEFDLVLKLTGLALILAPLSLLSGIAVIMLPILGVVGLFKIALMLRRGPKAVSQIAAQYAAVARHGEKLGLQASIGADLRALLSGWIPTPKGTAGQPSILKWRHGYLWSALLVISSVWLLGLTMGLVGVLNTATGLSWLGTSPSSLFGYVLLAIWCLITLGLIIILSIADEKTQKILLVVDDLDRCVFSEMVEILEAIKLLLEEEEISNRVQVLILIDEIALRAAITEKLQPLIRGSGTSADSVIREHIEKLFLCSLRIPELSADEVEELALNYIRLGEVEDVPAPIRPSYDADEPAISTAAQTANTDPTLAPVKQNNTVIEAPDASLSMPRRTSLFTNEERNLLGEAIRESIRQSRDHPPTPRQIRAFLTKYQLARVLCGLEASENSAVGRELIFKLAEACFLGRAPSVAQTSSRKRLGPEVVITQVM